MVTMRIDHIKSDESFDGEFGSYGRGSSRVKVLAWLLMLVFGLCFWVVLAGYFL